MQGKHTSFVCMSFITEFATFTYVSAICLIRLTLSYGYYPRKAGGNVNLTENECKCTFIVIMAAVIYQLMLKMHYNQAHIQTFGILNSQCTVGA